MSDDAALVARMSDMVTEAVQEAAGVYATHPFESLALITAIASLNAQLNCCDEHWDAWCERVAELLGELGPDGPPMPVAVRKH